MSPSNRMIYVPTHQNYDGEHYNSFAELIDARPDCKTVMDAEPSPSIPYHCVHQYPNYRVMV